MRYRKKPVVIEAYQYDSPTSLEHIMQWSGVRFVEVATDIRDPDDPNEFLRELVLAVKTLEGDMVITPGDYVIQGIQGEFYPCKPDIFEATYEAVTND